MLLLLLFLINVSFSKTWRSNGDDDTARYCRICSNHTMCLFPVGCTPVTQSVCLLFFFLFCFLCRYTILKRRFITSDFFLFFLGWILIDVYFALMVSFFGGNIYYYRCLFFASWLNFSRKVLIGVLEAFAVGYALLTEI